MKPEILVVGDRVLARSRRSKPGAWWELNLAAGTCPCPSRKPWCDHLEEAGQHLAGAALQVEARRPAPSPAPPRASVDVDDVFAAPFVGGGARR